MEYKIKNGNYYVIIIYNKCGGIMKNNIKFVIYILILVIFASVIWIKYDYENNMKRVNKDTSIDERKAFMENHNITSLTFTCPAKNETIIYLDNNYLLTDNGILYQVNYNSLFDNGYNCKIIEVPILFKGFYNDKILYDDNDQLYDVENDFKLYDTDIVKYYKEEINNLNLISKKYPYIYFYDVEAKNLALDNSMVSSKLLIDNKGNINIYTNYGYPTALNLLESEDTEVIFERLDYMGNILSIYRSNNNDVLDKDKVKYLNMLEDTHEEIYGLRVITNKGMYNEIVDKDCKDKICNTKLVNEKEFSKHFNNIVYSNGKYIFIKETPTTIYNIEKYVTMS